MDLRLGEQICGRLTAFVLLLTKWNKAYNLTAVREPEAMISYHLLDCLAIRPWIKGERILDVGSGAGLPGMVLAIADPELDCVLLDSNGKKTRFLNQAAFELKLDNVEVVCARAEAFNTQQLFSTVTARAVASVDQLYRITGHLLARDGRLLAMKGPLVDRELALFRQDDGEIEVRKLVIPGVEAERSLLIVDKSGSVQ